MKLVGNELTILPAAIWQPMILLHHFKRISAPWGQLDRFGIFFDYHFLRQEVELVVVHNQDLRRRRG